MNQLQQVEGLQKSNEDINIRLEEVEIRRARREESVHSLHCDEVRMNQI